MKKIIACFIIVFIHLLSIFILCYMPFVQMNQIDTWEQIGSCKDDKILNYKTRLQLYPHCWFIHKGDTYTGIPLIDAKKIKQNANIKFNWDNSITINNDTSRFELYVNKVEIVDKSFYVDVNNPYKLPRSKDSLFIKVKLSDINNNSLTVYRQSNKMYYGRKRIGFLLKIDSIYFATGVCVFDY